MPRRRRIEHPWYDAGWPLFVGVVAGLGVVTSYVVIGLLPSLTVLVLTQLAVAPTAASILADVGVPARRAALELAPACALATVVTLGLTASAHQWGLLLLLALLATSPLLRGQEAGAALARRYGADRGRVRRRFDEIVAHAFVDDDPS
jgi:hypothetical protein